MCSTEAALLGVKLGTDIQKERTQTAANITRAKQTNEANRIQSINIRESLKAKLVSSLKQEAQEIKKTAKKQEQVARKGRAEYASILASNPFQVGSNTLDLLLRDSQRREFETKFSMSSNLKTLRSQLQTGRQIDIFNTGVQLASLPIADAYVGDPSLAILGAVGEHGSDIVQEAKRLSSNRKAES